MQHIHQLSPDELLSIPLAPGSVIEVDSGVMWLTEESLDVILRSGQCHRLTRDSEVLVQAITPVRFQVRLPRQTASGWQRLWQLMTA